jgi:Protein of unknown function (DUF3562)
VVPDAALLSRHSLQADESVIASLAKATHTAHDVVKDLYYEEMAKLNAKATVKNFIGVIAGRRVKQRLAQRRRAS